MFHSLRLFNFTKVARKSDETLRGIEREYRLLRVPEEDESFYFDSPADLCRRVAINTKK